MMKYLIIVIIVSGLLAIILKCLNTAHIKRARSEQEQMISESKLLRPNIRYSDYKRVAEKTSVPNTQVRESGDFWDFLRPSFDDLDPMCIENHLFCADGGEFDE